MLWVIFGIIVCIIIIVTIYSRIYIIYNFTYSQQEQKLLICIYYCRIRLLKREYHYFESKGFDMWKLLHETDNLQSKLKHVFHRFKEANQFMSSLIQKFQIHKLTWQTKVGTGEASMTGLAIGSMWIIKGLVIGIISEQSDMKCRPNIAITPLFQHKHIDSQLDCIVSIRIGQTIYALIKLLRKTPSKKEVLI